MRIESSVTGMESERSFSAVSYSARSFKTTKTGAGSYIAPGMSGGSGFLNTLLGKYGADQTGESTDAAKEVLAFFGSGEAMKIFEKYGFAEAG